MLKMMRAFLSAQRLTEPALRDVRASPDGSVRGGLGLLGLVTTQGVRPYAVAVLLTAHSDRLYEIATE